MVRNFSQEIQVEKLGIYEAHFIITKIQDFLEDKYSINQKKKNNRKENRNW